MAAGKWHVARRIQAKVARGACHSVHNMALSVVDDVILQSPK